MISLNIVMRALGIWLCIILFDETYNQSIEHLKKLSDLYNKIICGLEESFHYLLI